MPFPLCPLWNRNLLLDPHLGSAFLWGRDWGPEALGLGRQDGTRLAG